VKPLARIGRREREVVERRRADGYGGGELAHFGGRLEPTLRALLDQLLPGRPPTIDLVAFVDRHAEQPMGRGDRREGVPPTPELLVRGVTALADEGFAVLPEGDQRAIVARMRSGEPHGALGELAKEFVDRLLDKALAGYLAHPDTWARIGFNGPAYPEGYAWIGTAEVVARHDGKPGWDRL
jgi:hypothetical protein